MVRQSAILKYIYDILSTNLSAFGKDSSLFSVNTGGELQKKAGKTMVHLTVSDIVQTHQDKNGEVLTVEEMRVPAPTHVLFVVTLFVTGKDYSSLLESVGAIIQYLKDNSTIAVGDYNWHGNEDGYFYLEPIVREASWGRGAVLQEEPCLSLQYQIEAAINSAKTEGFTRVTERDIRSNILDDK